MTQTFHCDRVGEGVLKIQVDLDLLLAVHEHASIEGDWPRTRDRNLYVRGVLYAAVALGDCHLRHHDVVRCLVDHGAHLDASHRRRVHERSCERA